MGQAFGAEGHDKGKLSEKASKKDIHPGSTPTYNHHIYKKKNHWAIYKDYFDDSYHSPPRKPPERKTSIFHYYKKEKEIYPELTLRPKRDVGNIKQRPVHEYVPRLKFDEIEENIHDEKNTHTLKELLLMYHAAVEKNSAVREEMFLSMPKVDANIIKITTNKDYLQKSKDLLHETELQLRIADKALKEVEEELDTLLRAKKKDKINIAAAHKVYRECNKSKSRAEKALFNLLKEQEGERESLWKHCRFLERETESLVKKMEDKAEEKRQRDIEDKEIRALLGESEVPIVSKIVIDNQSEEPPPPTLEEILQEEIRSINEIVHNDNHLDQNFQSTMRMQHEPGEALLKVLDKTLFEKGMLLLIGENDKIELRGYEGEPEIILDSPMLHIHVKDTLVRAVLNLDGHTRQMLESKQAKIDEMHHELHGQSDELSIDVGDSINGNNVDGPDPLLPRTPGGSPFHRPISPGLPSLLNLDPFDFEDVLNTHERREREKIDAKERIMMFKKDIREKDIHIIVVGAGLAGLIAARDLASEGFYVELLEASDRVGGRIYTEEFPGTEESIDMGGEWIYPHVHETMMAECQRYGLDIKQNQQPERKRFLYQRDMKRCDTKDEYMIPVPPEEEDEFGRVMKQINYDASELKFEKGFDEPNIVLYDISYHEYVTTYLKATKSVREFLFGMGFQYVQSDPREYSAVNILKIISGFELEEDTGNGFIRSADDAFFLKPYRIATCAGSLIDCIYQELIHQHKHHVKIRLNAAVSLVNFVPGRADEYEEPPFVLDEDRFNHFFIKPEIPEPVHSGVGLLTTRVDIKEEESVDERRKQEKALRDSYHVKIVTMDGEIITGNGLIMALPLNTLGSLKFEPKVHDSIERASIMCNVATGYKMWSIMSNISPDTDHVIRVLNEYNTLNRIDYDVVQQSYIKSRKLQRKTDKDNVSRGNVSMVAYCAIDNVTDPKALELEMKVHHPYCNVRRIICHDFCADTWARSNGFVVKAGGYKLYAAAAKHAEYPYYPDKRISIIGADVSPVWTGFMEGAAFSGRKAAVNMREFLSARPIAYNDTGLAPGNEEHYAMYKHLLTTDGNLKENLEALRQQYYHKKKMEQETESNETNSSTKS